MRNLLFYPLLLLLLLLGAIWWNLDRLTQQVVRPWLVEELGQALQAVVSIDTLALDWPRLLVEHLRLVGKDGLNADIAEIELHFSLKSLLQMRLDKLIVRRPEVLIGPAGSGNAQTGMGADLPEVVPLRIDHWVLEAGSLQVALPDRTLALHKIGAHGSLGEDFTFAVQALFGEDPAVGFQLNGAGQWRQGLAVTLTDLVWDGQSLLPEKVTFRPSRLADAGIRLAFERLDSSAVEALLGAAGEPAPWPQSLHWQAAEPDLAVQWSGQAIKLQMTTAEGSVKTAESLWTWQHFEMQATGEDSAWQVSAAIGLAGASRLQVTGQWRGQDFQGDWSFGSADPLTLAAMAGVVLPEGAPGLNDLELAGKLEWQDGGLALSGVSMQAGLSGEGLSAAVSGALALQADSRTAEISLRQISLDKLEYSNVAGTAVVTGGSLEVSGSLQFSRQQCSFQLRGRSSFSEALLGSWYGELGGLPVNFAAQGGWEFPEERLRLESVAFDLAGLAAVDGRGAVSSGRMSLQGELEIKQLAGNFQETLQRLASDLVPGIEQLELAGGISAETALETHGTDWSFRLLMQPAEVTFRWGDALRLTGLGGRVPVLLRQGESLPEPGVVSGFLQWNALDAGLVNTGRGTLRMEASANRWRLQEPLELTAAGGLVHVKRFSLVLEDLTPKALASLQFSNLDLAQLTGSFGWPEMTGRLNASLEDVRFSQAEIVTAGEAGAEVFGGSLQLRNLRVEAPLSRFPTYHADVDFSGFDLQELTQTFEFGEINGVADGFVHDLRLFDGIPSAFQAKFETRTEGTRNISVKAIRNLNTLSQGGLSAALSQGIYQFIDFYRYRKIGIFCSLRNDQFHVRGLARDDSEKVLVDGGILPPKIDVLISSPTISFKEMLQRLKRIDRTGR